MACKCDKDCDSRCFDCPEFEAALKQITDEQEAQARQAEVDRTLV